MYSDKACRSLAFAGPCAFRKNVLASTKRHPSREAMLEQVMMNNGESCPRSNTRGGFEVYIAGTFSYTDGHRSSFEVPVDNFQDASQVTPQKYSPQSQRHCDHIPPPMPTTARPGYELTPTNDSDYP